VERIQWREFLGLRPAIRASPCRALASAVLAEQTSGKRILGIFEISAMSLSALLEQSFDIAWNYLQASGEIEDVVVANRFLTDTIDLMIRAGRRNKLILSNRAIIEYQQFKRDRIVEFEHGLRNQRS
jgi:predicted ribosome quality control (RQC) complex YloA/Tae2 family protein